MLYSTNHGYKYCLVTIFCFSNNTIWLIDCSLMSCCRHLIKYKRMFDLSNTVPLCTSVQDAESNSPQEGKSLHNFNSLPSSSHGSHNFLLIDRESYYKFKSRQYDLAWDWTHSRWSRLKWDHKCSYENIGTHSKITKIVRSLHKKKTSPQYLCLKSKTINQNIFIDFWELNTSTVLYMSAY